MHLIRGVGGKALSTLKWESGLRGADFVRIRPPRKLKNKVRLYESNLLVVNSHL